MNKIKTSMAFGAAVLIGAVACSGAASASTVVYTDQAAFVAASGALTLQNFNGFTGTTNLGTAPLTVGGFGVSVSSNSSAAISPGGASDNIDGSEFLFANLTGTVADPGALTFTFASAITSFGANFVSFNNNVLRESAVIGGVAIDPLPMSPNFLGFVSNTAFTSITFRNQMGGGNNDSFGLDNVRYSVAAVPEPATWAMMLVGFGMMGAAMRYRRRSTKAVYA
jgi:hypothetical protein